MVDAAVRAGGAGGLGAQRRTQGRRRRELAGLPEPEKLLQLVEETGEAGHDHGVQDSRQQGAILLHPLRSDAQGRQPMGRQGW